MYLSVQSAEQLLDDLVSNNPDVCDWLLLLAECHADEVELLLAKARERSIKLYGGVFPGLIYQADQKQNGVIAYPLSGDTKIIPMSLDESRTRWNESLPSLQEIQDGCAWVYVDNQSPNISQYLDTLYDRYSTAISYVGAGAGYHDLRPQHSIFDDQGWIKHGSLLVISPDHARVSVKHGWSRLAGPFIATRTEGNVVKELNWEPAGSFYRSEVGKLAPELKDKPVFPYLNSTYPLSIGKQEAEDVVRDPIDINSDDEIVFLSDVAENSAIYLSNGNKDSLISSAREATQDCLELSDPEICFVSDCYSRALMLGDDLEIELRAVCDVLQSVTDKPLEGVLALGEICGNENSSLEFYNKTFVISLSRRY